MDTKRKIEAGMYFCHLMSMDDIPAYEGWCIDKLDENFSKSIEDERKEFEEKYKEAWIKFSKSSFDFCDKIAWDVWKAARGIE